MMTLYHGSFMEVTSPQVDKGRKKVDFGQGFYLTRLSEQALDVFYNSKTYNLLTNPATGLQLMSDDYILEDLRNELEGNKTD